MGKYKDQEFLLSEQYQNASKLGARIKLHEQFSTNTYSWFLWVFDTINLPPICRILELGCGPGDLWLENINRIPKGWDITLSDLSIGMIQQAVQTLSNQSHLFKFTIVDVQRIPYPDLSFDAVIANHMFYHVPDRQKALEEIQRVTKKEGLFFAATVGDKHMKELPELVARFDPNLVNKHDEEKNEFTLESGYDQLIKSFPDVKIFRQESNLHITKSEPLVNYVLSSFRLGVGEERREEFKKFIEFEMSSNNGFIRIMKDNGIFVASLE